MLSTHSTPGIMSGAFTHVISCRPYGSNMLLLFTAEEIEVCSVSHTR